MWRGLFSESCGFTYASLINVKYNEKVLYYKFGEGVICSIKIQKSTYSDINEKSAFRTIAIQLYKQPKETNRNSFSTLVISSVRADVVAKTDDEVYASCTIKMDSYFSFVFSTVPKKVQLWKISKVK